MLFEHSIVDRRMRTNFGGCGYMSSEYLRACIQNLSVDLEGSLGGNVWIIPNFDAIMVSCLDRPHKCWLLIVNQYIWSNQRTSHSLRHDKVRTTTMNV
jgi:hypothetical protein